MSIIGRKTEGPQNEAVSPDSGGKGSWFKDNQRPIIAVALIMVMAFVMRFVFAYGVSADSGFALSGGVLASEHLHTITEILDGGSFFGSDSSLNYPFGSVNSNPIFIDAVVALFAMIGKAFGMSSVEAGSAALASFSAVCGALAVIPMFFLGKEVLGTKKAGFVAAIFIAFCPVVISQTVFSNGTETGWILLLFIVLSLLVFRGLRSIVVSMRTEGPFKEIVTANRPAVRTAAMAGLVLALIVLSTNGFRSIVLLLMVAMTIMVIVGRFMYRDTRMTALFFSIIIVIGMAVAAAYYIPAQLWDEVLSGILISSAAAVIVCLSFSMLQRKPWVVTVPAYLIAVIAALVLLSVFVPDLYSDIVNGNTAYADPVASLTGGTLSTSHLSTNFGVVTMWLSVLVIGILIWNLPKNLGSLKYQFLVIFMVVCALFTTKSDIMSTIFSPVYALGFAYVVMWIFDHVDFKGYFTAIKNADLKHAWRKVLRPVPVATIIAVAGLLCVPIGMYAVDAAISSNNADDYEGMDLGAISYFVKTDDDWVTGPVLSSYKDTAKSGALVTWVDYAEDAATRGGFDVITDSKGNGAEAVANILLSDAVDGSSTASMLIYLLSYTGFNDDVKAKLVGPDMMTDDDYTAFVKIIDDLEYKVGGEYKSVRDIVLGDTDKYGILNSDVSDENLRYIFGSSFLTDNYDSYTIADMYSAVASYSGKDISYFMVDGTMFPMYYGYSSTFSTMGYVNGYKLTDDYGTVGQFLSVDYYTYYLGIYSYKDAMYDTLIWRAYIGLSPSEAGYDNSYSYLSALMKSDGSVKAHPGYGLSNFEVDYEHWYVMYNSDPDADASSDGWVKMLYTEADAKQDSEGGIINYLSGLPACLKFVPNTSGSLLSGTVTSAGTALKGVRVNVVDSDGAVRSTTTTDENGQYRVLVTGTGSQIKYYSGSTNLNDGILIKTVNYTGEMSGDLTVDSTSAGYGIFVDADGNDQSKLIYDIFNDGDGLTTGMKLTGKTSGRTYNATIWKTGTPPDEEYGFSWADVVPDVYTVTLSKGNISYVTTAEIKSYTGTNHGVKVTLESQEITFTVTDEGGMMIPGNHEVTITDMNNPTATYVKDTVDGVLTVTLVNGTYKMEFVDYATAMEPFTVSSGSTTSYDVKVFAPVAAAFTGFNPYQMVNVYSTGYQVAVAADSTGAVNIKLPAGTGAELTYTAYAVRGNQCKIAKTGSYAAATGEFVVSGTMKNSSDEAASGTIMFFHEDGYQIPVSVSSDGTYSAVLIGGNYTVYANSGTEVSYSTLNVTSSLENQDITLGKGKQISGTASWYSSSNKLPYLPITVSNITGCDGCTFVIITGNEGGYSFYIPSEATCDLTARLNGTNPFYFLSDSTHVDSKTETGVDGTKNFQASVNAASVRNDLTFNVKVAGYSVEKDGGTKDNIPVTGPSFTVNIDDGKRYATGKYWFSPMALDPGVHLLINDFDSIFEGSTIYYICEVTVADSNDVVTITALDDEAGDKITKVESGTTRTYYLESGKSFQVVVRNADSNKVFFQRIDTIADKATIDATSYANAATVTGFVGINKDGDMTLNYSATDYKFSISSGRYSILVPIGGAFTLLPTITEESDDHSYTYSLYNAGVPEAASVDASAWEAGKTYTYNYAVTSVLGDGTHTITATTAEVLEMDDNAIAQVKIHMVFSDSAAPTADTTYTLSGGSDWSNIAFYNNVDCAPEHQISAITFGTGTGEVWGLGTVVKSKVAFASENLTVTLTDINGEAACTSMIDGGVANWKFTEPTEDTTKVSIGSNSVGDSEYKYAVKIVNDDNFTKRFTLVPAGIDDKWFVTYVYGDEINSTGIIDVKGYTTATIYVKITSKGEWTDEVTAPEITTSITVTDPAGVREIKLSTETADEVTIAGNVASAKSKVTKSVVTVDETSAEGRDVLNQKSDMPGYIWFAIAVMVALVFIIIWAASKRGVFTRKK